VGCTNSVPVDGRCDRIFFMDIAGPWDVLRKHSGAERCSSMLKAVLKLQRYGE
jgi:hypothetical protein